MVLKTMLREWRALVSDPRTMLVTFAVPFLFWFFLPGFNSSAFPAVLVAYVLVGLFNSRGDSVTIKAGLTQFPVTARDHVTGMFLYQATALLVTGAVAALFMQLVGPEQFLKDVLPKALALGLLLTGVLTLMGLWFRPEVARIGSMLLIILAINFTIFQAKGTVFLPWLGLPAALALGAGGWLVMLLLGLAFPPRAG